MSQEATLKAQAEKLMMLKGKVRGEGILTDIKYVRYREGEKGVKIVEERLKKLGCPVKFEQIRPMDWYPVGLDVLKILVIKELFHWSDADIMEMAAFSAKVSFLVRMLMKYFISPQRSFAESPKYWRKNFNTGILEAYQFNEKEKYAVFRLREFEVHPIMCVVLRGYILQMAKYVFASKNITIEETKCMHLGDSYHEFIMKWG